MTERDCCGGSFPRLAQPSGEMIFNQLCTFDEISTRELTVLSVNRLGRFIRYDDRLIILMIWVVFVLYCKFSPKERS